MNLYERCVNLGTKLEAAIEADGNSTAVASGTKLADTLGQALDKIERTMRFRSEAGISERPQLDQKAIQKAVNAFRGSLSKHQLAALQHQHASDLRQTAEKQSSIAVEWAANQWKMLFDEYASTLDRAESRTLTGDSKQLEMAHRLSEKLRSAKRLNPVTNPDALELILKGKNATDWIQSFRVAGRQLRQILEELDTERNKLPPEVQIALNRAATREGLPLSEVTVDLLVALRAAGVDVQLVVKHP